MSPREPHCEHCGEPIGVYEPIVLFDGLNAQLTSRGAAGAAGLDGRACFHAECFAAGAEQDGGSGRDF